MITAAEGVGAMTTVAVEVRRAVRIPIGLQILAAANDVDVAAVEVYPWIQAF